MSMTKREVMEKVLAMWEAHPRMRLGQLLSNAIGKDNLFYQKDDTLVQELAHYTGRHASDDWRQYLAGHTSKKPENNE